VEWCFYIAHIAIHKDTHGMGRRELERDKVCRPKAPDAMGQKFLTVGSTKPALAG
jgi:hypothetical protein